MCVCDAVSGDNGCEQVVFIGGSYHTMRSQDARY